MKSIEGSIKKAPDGKRWVARVQYTDNAGRRRQKARYCVTFGAAKAKVKELRSDIENEKEGRVTYRQLDDFFRKEYLHSAKIVNGQKVSGFRQPLNVVKNYLDGLLEHFGDRPIESITYADLQEFKKKIAALPTGRLTGVRSVSDVNLYLKRLRRLFNIAIEQGWLSVNPFNRGGSLINESFEVERTRVLSPAEESRLLAACTGRRKHLRPVIIFAIETACRRGEMQLLRWSEINLPGRHIKIVGTTTKTLKTRLVPITDRLAESLDYLWQYSRKRQSDLVFGGADFKRAFNSACSDSGLTDVHFHDLRHTAITRMLEAGISPPLVMKISGHTQQKTFLRYVNQSETSIYEIAQKLSRAA